MSCNFVQSEVLLMLLKSSWPQLRICSLPCGNKVNILDEKKFNINPYANFYFAYYNINI